MSTPAVIHLANEPSGALSGKSTVDAYYIKALEFNSNFDFELISTLIRGNSITFYYRRHRGLSAECFHFNADQVVIIAYANYEA